MIPAPVIYGTTSPSDMRFGCGLASAYGLVALVLTIALAMPALRLLSGIFQQEGRR